MRYYRKPEILVPGPRSVSLDEHTVIEASAGTGKTYTLEHLYVSLILERGAKVEEILVVTFTRRAAADMKKRIRELLLKLVDPTTSQTRVRGQEEHYWEIGGQEVRRMQEALHAFDRAQISTIHTFAQNWLRRYAFETRQLFNGVLVDAEEVFERAYGELMREHFSVEPSNRVWLEAWYKACPAHTSPDQELMSTLKHVHESNSPVSPRFDEGGLQGLLRRLESGDSDSEFLNLVKTAVVQVFSPVVKDVIKRIKASQGLYTYDDMLSVLDEVVRRPSPNPLKDAMQNAYRYALIDEFQDTDPVQWRIFRTVFAGTGRHVVYLIGDPKQSIYGFRGADVQIYRKACEELLGERKPVRLSQNYRSTKEMIDAYNKIFQGYFTDPSTYPEPVSCARPRLTVNNSAGREPAITLLQSPKSALDPKQAMRESFAAEIVRILGPEGLVVSDGEKTRRLKPSDIYVLARRGKDGVAIAESLRARGVPFAFYRQEGLFQTHEARDIASLLASIADPRSRSLRRHALITPFFGVALHKVQSVDSVEGGWHQALLDQWQILARKRLYTILFDQILRTSGLIRRLVLLDSSERSLTNYEHLFELIAQEAGRREYEISDLATWMKRRVEGNMEDPDQDVNLQRLETDQSSVQIMTIHASKGLQAQVVFVYDEGGGGGHFGWKRFKRENGETGMFLAKNSAFDRDKDAYDRDENERLYYVALTRAISKLYLPDIAKKGAFYKQVVEHVLRQTPDEICFEFRPADAEEVAVPKTADFVKTLQSWEPPHTSTLANPGMSDNDIQELKKRVLQMASYSKLKANHTADSSELKVVDESEEVEEEGVKDPDAWGFIEPNHLPGGTKAGSMIHEVLEFVDFGFAASSVNAETWSGHPNVKELIETTMMKYRFEVETYWHDVVAMLWGTLNAEVPDGFNGLIAPLASLETSRVKREVRFVFPIPEKGRASRRQTKGFAEGFVDLLFEHQGRMYFADWKTDVLEHGDYSRRKLARRVRESYPAQATIYTLAITRMLGINNAEDFERKFGGFYYFFVRGMKRAGEGVYYERPSWEMVSTMDTELAGSDRHSWAELLAGGWR